MKNRYLLLVVLLLTGTLLRAQSVRGRVTDTNAQPVPGASVTATGTNRGTSTDANGTYAFTLDPGTYTLRVSAVGFETVNVPVTITTGEVATADVQLAEGATALQEVAVIGSRAATARTNTETPAPVDIISTRELTLTGQVEPTQMINFVAPSFNSSRQTLADGTDHIDPATLRGLGPDQVLVLVNGKRRHNQALINVNGTVGRGSVGTDLNAIPVSAIQRIEVLRDGASSQYGSDAIAGVINVVLKKDPGTSVNAQLGQQYAGDGRLAQVAASQGFKLGREGYLTAALDLRSRQGTNRAGGYTGPVYVNWTTVTDLALRQQRYAEDQARIRQNGFDLSNNIQVGNSAVDNVGLMFNGGVPLGQRTEFYFTGGYNYRRGRAAGFYRYPYQTSQIIPELYPNGFLPQIHSTINDRSVLVGVNGETASGWRWDVSNVYGGNAFRYDVRNTNNASQYALGAQAPTEFYAGTLVFNQNTFNAGVSRDFGEQVGLQTFNVAAGAEYRLDNYQIKPGEEASWRNYDPASGRAGGAQVFPGFQPVNAVNATRNVLGAYLDLESDVTQRLLVNVAGRFEQYSDFGGNFAGKLALRYKFADAFSLRGSLSNGFRAPSLHQRSYSAISTVFSSVNGQLQPRQQGTFPNGSVIAQAFGIPSLTAERSNNLSLGVTSRPARWLSLTVDAYQIDIRNRIVLTGQFNRGTSTVGQQVAQILDAAGQQEVNAAIFFTNAVNTRTQGLDLVLTASPRLRRGSVEFTLAGNLNRTEVQGEPRVSERLPSDVFGNVLFNRQERARLELAQPRSKFTFGTNYRVGKFGAYLRVTRFGEVASYDPTNPVLDEVYSPKVLTDLSVNYRLTNALTLTLGANNLFDVYPDKISNTRAPSPTSTAPTLDNTSFGRFVYPRAATQFGFNGGYYFVNVGVNF